MNFDYSEDQVLLKAEARKFLDASCSSPVRRTVLDQPEKSFDAALWQKIVDMGWTGAVIPERWGGTGLSHIELCALAEELGRALAPIPFASAVYIFAEALLCLGSEDQRKSLLPGVSNGTVIGCLASSEGRGFSDQSAAGCRVRAGRLTGRKIPVTDGDIATHAIVTALDDAGPGLFVVDLSAPGVKRERLETLDPTRSAAELTFEDAACERLGEVGAGEASLSLVLDRAAVLFSFEQVGGADKCLETARDYALTRYAFGKAIGSNQAIKHKLVDIYVKNELARSNAYYGAWALNTGAAELAQAAAAARLAGTQAYDFAAKESLHIHGGIGFTWEMDCHLHLRRSRQLGLALGSQAAWRERLVSSLEDCMDDQAKVLA